ncbi:MAG: hypothetical protein JRI25_22480 [Deltaproteobacteria bacterium]|nr:hypothetical protein [Deltaproteobacteria bacterium]
MPICATGLFIALLGCYLVGCGTTNEDDTGDTGDTSDTGDDTGTDPFHPCDPGPVQHIYTGFNSDSAHYGLTVHANGLLTADWVTNRAIRVDLATDTVAADYPVSLKQSVGAHGAAYHTVDGTFWVADLDGSCVRQYDAQGRHLAHQAVGAQPVNIVPYGVQLIVPDRGQDKMYILKQADLTIEGSWDVEALDGDQNTGFIDVVVHDNRLHIVADEFPGVARADLDGANQDRLDFNSHHYMGIAIVDDTVILHDGREVVIGGLDGTVWCTWDIEPPGGQSTQYLDIAHVGDRLFFVSWISDLGLHLVAYEVGAPTR